MHFYTFHQKRSIVTRVSTTPTDSFIKQLNKLYVKACDNYTAAVLTNLIHPHTVHVPPLIQQRQYLSLILISDVAALSLHSAQIVLAKMGLMRKLGSDRHG